MNCRRALPILLALALVCAQQVALAHQLWHLLDPGTPSPQSQLCQQHAALDTVAGAVDAPAPLPAASVPVEFVPLPVALPAARAPGLAPSSRGPPALL